MELVFKGNAHYASSTLEPLDIQQKAEPNAERCLISKSRPSLLALPTAPPPTLLSFPPPLHHLPSRSSPSPPLYMIIQLPSSFFPPAPPAFVEEEEEEDEEEKEEEEVKLDARDAPWVGLD